MKISVDIRQHFRHYYYNIPVKLALALVAGAVRENKFDEALSGFKDASSLVRDLQSPLELMASLQLGALDDFCQEVQVQLESFDQAAITFKTQTLLVWSERFEGAIASQDSRLLQEIVDGFGRGYESIFSGKVEEFAGTIAKCP